MLSDREQWFKTVENVLKSLASLRLLQEQRHDSIAPRTSGAVLRATGGSRHWTPRSTSEPERFVLKHEADIMAEKVLQKLRPLVLTWLEGAILLHHYSYEWPLEDVAEKTNVHVGDVAKARKSLVRKVAIALGYIPGKVETRAVPMTRAERQREAAKRRPKVAELHRQGLDNRQIAKKLGVSVPQVKNDVNVLRKQGVLPSRAG